MKWLKFSGILIQTDYLIPGRKAGLVLINKKKELAIPVVRRAKIKESEKMNKYSDLPR